MRFIIIALFLFLFSGCTIQDPSYDFRLVGWSNEENIIISDAIDDWNSSITMNNSSENIIIKKDQMELKQFGYVYFSNNYNSKWATIEMLKDLNNKQIKMTIHHEIGHFLSEMNGNKNWRDHLPSGNAMSATEQEASEDLTEADIAYAFGN